MKFHTISMSMFLALSISGCAAGEDGLTTEPAEPEVCEATGAPCGDDSICGEDGCEPAFDRTYRIGVASVWFSSTKQLQLCEQNPGCAFESTVSVFFSELDDPIMVGASLGSQPANILVPRGSNLVIDLGDTTCVVDLTAERLSAGLAGCAGPGASISLSINAL